MKPIKFKDVHGDKSDLICIECATESVENPPFLCSRCGQPVEFGEHFYILKMGTIKPGGPNVDFKEISPDDKCICVACYEEFMTATNNANPKVSGTNMKWNAAVMAN